MKFVHLFGVILVLLGGLNWTLFGMMQTDLFAIIGGGSIITTLLYLLTTVATLFLVLPRFMQTLSTS